MNKIKSVEDLKNSVFHHLSNPIVALDYANNISKKETPEILKKVLKLNPGLYLEFYLNIKNTEYKISNDYFLEDYFLEKFKNSKNKGKDVDYDFHEYIIRVKNRVHKVEDIIKNFPNWCCTYLIKFGDILEKNLLEEYKKSIIDNATLSCRYAYKSGKRFKEFEENLEKEIYSNPKVNSSLHNFRLFSQYNTLGEWKGRNPLYEKLILKIIRMYNLGEIRIESSEHNTLCRRLKRYLAKITEEEYLEDNNTISILKTIIIFINKNKIRRLKEFIFRKVNGSNYYSGKKFSSQILSILDLSPTIRLYKDSLYSLEFYLNVLKNNIYTECHDCSDYFFENLSTVLSSINLLTIEKLNYRNKDFEKYIFKYKNVRENYLKNIKVIKNKS